MNLPNFFLFLISNFILLLLENASFISVFQNLLTLVLWPSIYVLENTQLVHLKKSAPSCSWLECFMEMLLKSSVFLYIICLVLLSLINNGMVKSPTIAAMSLQSCPTLCDPIDGSPPGSPVVGFSRQEHWRGLPFPSQMQESEKWKWSCSVVSNS